MSDIHESLLLKWADCLEIPSGTFVNDDLRAAAAELTRLRADLAEAQGSAKLNGLMCDLGFANLDTWRDETIWLRAALAEAERAHDKLFNSWRAAEDAASRLGAKWKRAEADLAAAREVITKLMAASDVLLDEANGFNVSGVYFSEKCMNHKGPDLVHAATEEARAFLERTDTDAVIIG